MLEVVTLTSLAMQRAFCFCLTVLVALVASCSSSHAQKPKEYVYEYPCDLSWEPARIVTYRLVGQADTTLAVLNGRIVNYLGTYGTDIIAAKNAVNGEVVAVPIGKQGQFVLYAPTGRYEVRVLSLDYISFVVENVDLVAGQNRQLELHLQQSASNTTMCEYKSTRKLSLKRQRALGIKFQKLAIRNRAERTKEDASAKLTLNR